MRFFRRLWRRFSVPVIKADPWRDPRKAVSEGRYYISLSWGRAARGARYGDVMRR